MANRPKKLLDLPDEILSLIAEAVDDITSLRALARTCTRFQDHAERFIYRSLTIESGAAARALYKAINRRPQRATMALRLTAAPGDVATRGTEHIPTMLEMMNRVKHVFIESPFCNKPAFSEFVEDQERYGQIIRKSSLHVIDPSERLLSKLVSCTLNFTGFKTRICTVDADLGSIFLHPNLERLTISCARFHGTELGQLDSFTKETPLSSLFLDQCDISASSLAMILSLPASLKTLKLLEIRIKGPQQYALDYSPALLEALCLQRTSLESLTMSLRNPKLSPFSQPFDLSRFLALRLLKISVRTRGEFVYPNSVDWTNYAPPSLDTLVFSDINISTPQSSPKLPSELEACLKRLTPLGLCCLARTVCLCLRAESHMHAEGREGVEKLGDHLRSASSRLSDAFSPGAASGKDKRRVSPRLCINQLTRARGAYAPYLYREYKPEEFPLYDSSSEGSGWLTSKHPRDTSPPFSQAFSGCHLNHFGQYTDDFSHPFDFDSFLNNGPTYDIPGQANTGAFDWPQPLTPINPPFGLLDMTQDDPDWLG